MAPPLLVTGGAGFIGSAFIRKALSQGHSIINLDALTYASSQDALAQLNTQPLHRFVQGDIRDAALLTRLFTQYKPKAVVHFAAETHVDRSIDGPAAFIETNIVGTQILLDGALNHFKTLPKNEKERFRFLHVSTDEVFGSLGVYGYFDETTAYDPRSPYSASKAASDHLVRAWHHTYGLPTLITNCTNNYGPFQFPEKLIPLMILRALRGQTLPIYGTGSNIRDWLYVDDHAVGLLKALQFGIPGESYCFGGDTEKSNLDIVEGICSALDTLSPRFDGRPHRKSIRFVVDRPGHDFRYAMDTTKVKKELGWSPSHSFEKGLSETLSFYLAHQDKQAGFTYKSERLGLCAAG